MTTSETKIESTTPQLAARYEEAKPQEAPPISCSSSVTIMALPLANTVFANPSQSRVVIVNPDQINASLEVLERNRKLQEMGLG